MSRILAALLCWLILSLISILSCTTMKAPPIDQKQRSAVELEPCNFPSGQADALCGKYPVYENRAAKSGRMIALNIVVLRALAAEPKPDAVFFLAGGPGQGTAFLARSPASSLLTELRREHDLVFVDLRGTGDSHRLQCASKIDRSVVQSYFAEPFDVASVRACREALEQIADLKHYTTSDALDDLKEVRAALGYNKINLYGVSYGTLIALQYLRRYPQELRSVALAGVLTPAAKLPLHFAKAGQQALERLFEDCAADESCQSAYPDLRTDFARVLAALDNGPITFELVHPVSKTLQTVNLSRAVFTERLRALLHSHESARLIPLMINHAARGNWTTFGRIVIGLTAPQPFGIAMGVYYSVTCSESVPTIRAEDIQRESQPTFLGTHRTQRHQQACASWRRANVPAEFYQPVHSDVPTLMLSGDIDPATPPELAKQARLSLSNARQIVLRNTAHNYDFQCARKMVVEFIAQASATELATDCVESLRRPSFLRELPERFTQ